jgi:cell division septation protein DedD
MKLLSRFNVSRENNGPRKFSFEISMSGVVSVGIVVVLGMCWVFILGILVGRGYRPESAVPQIAQMMPTTETTLPDNTTTAAPPSVLKPEELQFMDLQDKEGEVVADSTQKSSADGKKSPPLKSRDLIDARSAPMGSAVAATSVAAVPAKNAPQPSIAPIPAAKAAPTPKAPSEDAHAAKSKVDPKAPFEKTSRYTATYQVASFPAREQADTLVKNLTKKGITASIQEAKSNKSTVFRVNIQIKGTEADIAEGLKKTGEKGPILLGKKPL